MPTGGGRRSDNCYRTIRYEHSPAPVCDHLRRPCALFRVCNRCIAAWRPLSRCVACRLPTSPVRPSPQQALDICYPLIACNIPCHLKITSVSGRCLSHFAVLGWYSALAPFLSSVVRAGALRAAGASFTWRAAVFAAVIDGRSICLWCFAYWFVSRTPPRELHACAGAFAAGFSFLLSSLNGHELGADRLTYAAGHAAPPHLPVPALSWYANARSASHFLQRRMPPCSWRKTRLRHAAPSWCLYLVVFRRCCARPALLHFCTTSASAACLPSTLTPAAAAYAGAPFSTSHTTRLRTVPRISPSCTLPSLFCYSLSLLSLPTKELLPSERVGRTW